MSDELILEIDPPYIGSAVSPTVDITETTTDVTVTITDYIGDHAYTIEKTDQAIADAEQAATNANTAAANATSTANQAAQYARSTADQAAQDAQATADAAAGRADTAAGDATSAAQAATQAAGTANTSAQNADTKAALADSKATLANTAATTANQAAQAAEAAKTAANTAAGQATTAAGNASTAAGAANTAASNADAKAQLADTAATNADTATQAANTATTNATNAAQAANNAAAVAIEAAETITDGYFPHMLAGAAESLMDGTDTATFAERVSSHDGVARIESILGNTIVWNQLCDFAKATHGMGFTNETDDGATHTISAEYSTSSNAWIGVMDNVAVASNHKYLLVCDAAATKAGLKATLGVYQASMSTSFIDSANRIKTLAAANSYEKLYALFAITAVGTGNFYARVFFETGTASPEAGDTCRVRNMRMFDLTQMFGAGNEPATVAEFEALYPETYYPYDAGSLLNVNMEGVRTVGFNQWDEEWEVGTISTTTGANSSSTTQIRSKNLIPVTPNQTYFILTSQYVWMLFYDENGNVLTDGLPEGVYSADNARSFGSTTNKKAVTIPGTCRYVRFYCQTIYGTTYNNDICINISDPTRNGEYKPYTTDTREIPVSTYFLDGMKSAGSVHDELTRDKAVKRVGVVDLGTLAWSYAGTSDISTKGVRMQTGNPLESVKAGNPPANVGNIVCEKYASISANSTYVGNIGIALEAGGLISVYDTSYNTTDSVAAFKTAMSGVMLYYELATPVETEITPPLTMTYTVEQGGTESIVIPTGEQSAAPTMAIVYGLTADGVVDKALSVIAHIEGATASTNYSVNAYLVHDQQLYRVTSAIATGEAITPGSNCVACTVMGELARLTA